MSDPLDDLKSVHRHEQAAVPGHWTVEHLERGIAEIERLRAENVIMRGALDTIYIAANAARRS